MADISMSLDDTLELDTIIKASNIAQDPIGNITYSGSNTKDYNMNGIETHTSVFDPQQAGSYTIPVNGQELSVEVTDPSTIPDSGVSRWTFDDADTESGTAIDSWGGNYGTINGTTTGVTGANQTYSTNEAYDFDGTDDTVEYSGFPSLTTPVTYAVWVYSRATSHRFISNDSTPTMYIRIDGGHTLGANIYDGSNSRYGEHNGITSLNQNQWYHIIYAVDSDNGEGRVYVDGSKVTTVSDSGEITLASGITIGTDRSAGSYVDGIIDDPRVYDEALTDLQASDLYNNGSI